MGNAVNTIAKIRAAKGKADPLESLLREQVAAVRKAEPGCQSYKLHRSDSDPLLFLIYEQYVDEAARKAHENAPHLKAFRERRVAEGLVDGATGVERFIPLTD